MAVIQDPNNTANIARVGAVDTSADAPAQHTDVRPICAGSLGHFVTHAFTGNIAAGAAGLSELLQLRYTGTNKMVITDVWLEHFRSLGTAFAAGNFLFDCIKATAWTVDGTGGANQTPEKLRESMAAPTHTIRIATTAALGAGTKTLKTQPYRAIRGIVSTAINGMQLGSIAAAANVTVGYPLSGVPLLAPSTLPNPFPVVLAINEGLVIRATVPGTGVWEASFTIRAVEVENY